MGAARDATVPEQAVGHGMSTRPGSSLYPRDPGHHVRPHIALCGSVATLQAEPVCSPSASTPGVKQAFPAALLPQKSQREFLERAAQNQSGLDWGRSSTLTP